MSNVRESRSEKEPRVRIPLTMRDLEHVVAVADTGSVTRAAMALNVSQPTVSSAITQLEATLEVHLFVRTRGQGVHLTPEGHLFVAEARRILAQVRQLHESMIERSGAETGRIVIASLATVAPIVMASLLRSFAADHPRLQPELITGSQDQVLGFLATGVAHVAVTYDLGLDDEVHFEPLRAALPHVMISSHHPMAQRSQVSLGELVDEHYLLLDLPISRDYFSSLFTAAGLQVRPTARHTDLELVRSLVGNGFGYSLVNLLPARPDATDATPLAYVPLATEVTPLHLGVATRRQEYRLRAVDAFIEHARLTL
jgi:DNA-binding transcriptional LysR family regulator